METFQLASYGRVISDSNLGGRIYNDLVNLLDKNDKISIDLKDVISMATFCSKQIFGTLYVKLTPQVFFNRVTITNASEDIRIIIRLGIEKAIESQSIKSSN